jgi:hypothetical protein
VIHLRRTPHSLVRVINVSKKLTASIIGVEEKAERGQKWFFSSPCLAVSCDLGNEPSGSMKV